MVNGSFLRRQTWLIKRFAYPIYLNSRLGEERGGISQTIYACDIDQHIKMYLAACKIKINVFDTEIIQPIIKSTYTPQRGPTTGAPTIKKLSNKRRNSHQRGCYWRLYTIRCNSSCHEYSSLGF